MLHQLYAYQHLLDLLFNVSLPLVDQVDAFLYSQHVAVNVSACLFWLYNVLSVLSNSTIPLG